MVSKDDRPGVHALRSCTAISFASVNTTSMCTVKNSNAVPFTVAADKFVFHLGHMI